MRDTVIGCGISKPIAQLTTAYKDEIKKLICLRDVFFDSKSAIDQFKEGLDEVYTYSILHTQCM